jgi:hypothetical protein
MVSADVALKASMYFWMMMFIGMTTFPDKFMAAYSDNFWDCPKKPVKGAPKCDTLMMKTFVCSIFGLAGVQMLIFISACSAMSRPAVSQAAKSAACLVTMIFNALFAVSDLYQTTKADWPTDEIPKEGMYVNMVIWLALAGLAYSGWKEAGEFKPKLDGIVPSGRFGLPLAIGSANLLFYAIPLVLFADTFVKDGFGRGDMMAGFTPAVNFLLSFVFGNIGKMCLINVAMTACVAQAGGEDAQYRLLRGGTHAQMFSLGMFGKDAIVNMLIGFEDPMRLFVFATSFAIMFYQINVWAGAPYKLDKVK